MLPGLLVFSENAVVTDGCPPAWRVEVANNTLLGCTPNPAGVELIGVATAADAPCSAPPPDTLTRFTTLAGGSSASFHLRL